MNQQQKWLAVNNLNKYDFYEYQRPLTFAENDYRTSTGRGHRFYFQKDVPTGSMYRKHLENQLNQTSTKINSISETKNLFPYQYPFKNEERASDLTFQSDRPEFVRNFEEKVRQNLLIPIKEYQTTNSLVYTPKDLPPEPEFVKSTIGNQLYHPCNITPSNAEGYMKYLDAFATTSVLTHIPFTSDMQHGIAKKDAITFYDWMQYPKTHLGYGLKDTPVKGCTKVVPIYDTAKFLNITTDRERPKTYNSLPHNGFQTESRENYKFPVGKTFHFKKTEFIPNVADSAESWLQTKNTEYSVIGGHKRVHSYLKAERN